MDALRIAGRTDENVRAVDGSTSPMCVNTLQDANPTLSSGRMVVVGYRSCSSESVVTSLRRLICSSAITRSVCLGHAGIQGRRARDISNLNTPKPGSRPTDGARGYTPYETGDIKEP